MLAAYLLPVSVDGTVAAAPGDAASGPRRMRHAVAGLRDARVVGSSRPWLRTSPTVPGSALTGALLSGWPAVAFIGSAEMAIGMVRTPPGSGLHGSGNPLSQNQLMERFGLIRLTLRQLALNQPALVGLAEPVPDAVSLVHDPHGSHHVTRATGSNLPATHSVLERH